MSDRTESSVAAYIVSRRPDRGWRWWRADETLPPGEVDVRPATPAETALMDRITRADAAGRMPPAGLGRRLKALIGRPS